MRADAYNYLVHHDRGQNRRDNRRSERESQDLVGQLDEMTLLSQRRLHDRRDAFRSGLRRNPSRTRREEQSQR